MGITTTHAQLHPRHLLDSRMARERRRIAERYEPSAREMFAARDRLNVAPVVISEHRRRRQEKRMARWQKTIDALQGMADAARRAAASLDFSGRAA